MKRVGCGYYKNKARESISTWSCLQPGAAVYIAERVLNRLCPHHMGGSGLPMESYRGSGSGRGINLVSHIYLFGR